MEEECDYETKMIRVQTWYTTNRRTIPIVFDTPKALRELIHELTRHLDIFLKKVTASEKSYGRANPGSAYMVNKEVWRDH